MIPLENALAAYATELRPLPAQTVATLAALGRVLAADVYAETDLPRLDSSAMDGYALCAADTPAATATNPIDLPIQLHLPARGSDRIPVLTRGNAARILTGALMPEGADVMIPQERAELVAGKTVLRITAPCVAGRNVRHRAEELARGTLLGEAGQRIGPGLLASLVNADVETVTVHGRPRIRVFVTGDEIRPFGTPLRPGEIHDSNGPLTAAVLAGWGYAPEPARHLGDDRAEVRAALEQAFTECDLVISTGGASVGDKDYLPATAEAIGARRVFWKVAQKPGKPIFFGVLERADATRCTMLALPGNPGAVLIGLLLHARAALDVLEGMRKPGAPWHSGVLADDVERDPERTRLIRMQLGIDDAGSARLRPLPNQDSHMLSNLGWADVLVWVEAGETIVPAGTVLRWTPMPA